MVDELTPQSRGWGELRTSCMEQFPSSKKKKKKNTDSFYSACITRHIEDLLHLNALPGV